jgi:endo-1,4-beta-xylanase
MNVYLKSEGDRCVLRIYPTITEHAVSYLRSPETELCSQSPTMVSFTTALFVLAAVAGVFGAPAEIPAESTLSRRSSPNAQGTNNGFFYQFCMEPPAILQRSLLTYTAGTDGGGGSATYTNKAAGEYSVTWSSISDMTSGKGWKNASPRNITFKGNVNAQGNFYLAVYTWSQQGENYVGQVYAI